MEESNEYVEKLKKFADAIGGTFQYYYQGTKSMVRDAKSRVEISIPQSNTNIYFTAYNGNTSTDTYSGFFAPIKLSSDIQCKITRTDPLDKLFNLLSKDIVKSSHSGLDKSFTVKTNSAAIVRQLSGKKSIRKFFELNLAPPLHFEIIDNEKGFIKDMNEKTNLIALKSNEWLVDHKQLNILLDGFKLILNVLN